MKLEAHHPEENALVDVDLVDGQARDARPGPVRVVAILEVLARGNQAGQKHAPATQERAVLRRQECGELCADIGSRSIGRTEGRRRISSLELVLSRKVSGPASVSLGDDLADLAT